MSNSIAPGSSADVNIKVTALTTNQNVPVTYKTIILKKNLVNGVNTLTQEMINQSNIKYVIKYNFNLSGENITIPEGCLLEFDGGSLNNGTINGNNTVIIKCNNFDFNILGSFITEPHLYIENFGAAGDGIQDDAPSIRKAFEFIRHCKNQCILNLKKDAVYLLKTHNENVFFNVCSNIYINGNNATFKIADNIGDYYKVFNCDKCENVQFSNFTIDENTTNNPITQLTGNGDYIHSRVLFWGWARMKNVTLTNIIMKDVIGVWQFTFGYSENINIKDCKIIYNTSSETPKYDRTSIYMGGDNCSLRSCKLIGDFKNANTAIEFHGNNIIAEENEITGYAGGILLVNDEASDTIDNKNLIVRNNYIYTIGGCLALWFAFDNRNVDGVYITENVFKYKKHNAIRVHHETGSNCIISNILIKNNKISIDKYITDSYTFYFDHLYTNEEVVNTVFNNFIIEENLISGEQNIIFYFEGNAGKSIPLYDNLNIRHNIITKCIENFVKVINVRTENSHISNNFIQKFTENRAAIIQFGSLSSNIKYENNIINNFNPLKNIAESTNKINGTFTIDYDIINTSDIQYLLNIYNKFSLFTFKNGTVFLKEGSDNKVVPICNIELEEEPKGLYITKGSVIKTKLNTYIINTTGIIPNHIAGTQINKVNEYVCTERGRYIYKVINENNKTIITDEDPDFTVAGNRAFYSFSVKAYIANSLPYFTQNEIKENVGSLFISPKGKTIAFLSEDGKLYSADGMELGVKRQGTFSDKPNNPLVGFSYFCTDRQTTEGITNGIMIYHKGNNVWVDALGRVVS